MYFQNNYVMVIIGDASRPGFVSPRFVRDHARSLDDGEEMIVMEGLSQDPCRAPSQHAAISPYYTPVSHESHACPSRCSANGTALQKRVVFSGAR